MIRVSCLLYPLAVFCFAAMTSCTSVDKHVLGDPQNPFPLKSKPQIGEIVHMPTGTIVSEAQMLAIIGDMRIVYMGETHDNPASHRLELQVLKELAERHPGRLALGMEMFVRSQQPVLDRWVAGELDEKAFLKESHWYDNWKMNYAYYRDLLNLAREKHIPVIALDAERKLVKAVLSKTPDQLSLEEKGQLPELDETDPYHRSFVEAIFGDSSHGKLQLGGFIRAQVLRDETMAESAARYLASTVGKDRHLLILAGGDHVRNGFGIPRRVFRRIPTSYAIISGMEINVSPDKKDRMMNVTVPDFPMVPYDFMVYQAYEDLPEAGVRLGVMVEPATSGQGLVIKEVQPGSNAKLAGLLEGDRLLAIDGETIMEYFDLTYAVQQKHAGDLAKLRIERNGRELSVEVELLATQNKSSAR